MYISGYDTEKHETVLINPAYVIRVHKYADNSWPVLETVDGQTYEVDEETEVAKVSQMIQEGVQVSKWESMAIEKMKLGNRAQNLLHRNKVENVQQILDMGRKGVLSIHGMGKTTFDEIEDRITELGVDWK